MGRQDTAALSRIASVSRRPPALPGGEAAESTWESLGEIAGAMMTRIGANSEESNTLAVLGDALLSELPSGEIWVKEVDKAVEAVT